MRPTTFSATAVVVRSSRWIARGIGGVIAALAPAAVAAPVVWSGPVTEMNGKSPTWVGFPTNPAAVSVRPQSAAQTAIAFQNYYIHDLTNQKALEVKVTDPLNGTPYWAYDSITLRNIKIHNVSRNESVAGAKGLHIDHIRISGAARQNHSMTLLLENIEIDGGDALPILIADGVFDTITFRNVIIKNTTNNVQIKTLTVGSVSKIVVENSPGLGVALIGRPGSIGDVLVRDSAGARIGDTMVNGARSGATISYIDSVGGSSGLPPVVAAPVPEPGTVGLVGVAAAAGLLRRRGR
ncbi:MAG TPA: PEP-CTERM sorting domain-containing protein [Tepidisphaeraceae bacterium]|nr:PEP-CTERM sorting domain-containing protein [Tepidisphaeraceae bacterium]